MTTEGYAVFVLDSFGARGVTSTIAKQTQVLVRATPPHSRRSRKRLGLEHMVEVGVPAGQCSFLMLCALPMNQRCCRTGTSAVTDEDDESGMLCSASHPNRCLYPRTCERQLPDALPGGTCYRVGNRGCRGPLTGLTRSEEGLARPIDHMDVHPLEQVIEPQDRIGAPIPAFDARLVEADRLMEGPARGLHDATFDLISDPVGVDSLTTVDC